jgi:signal transduction histidine kinase
MLRFLGSLKVRTAVTTSLVLAVILVVNGIYVIVTHQRDLRRDIERRAEMFAHLTYEPIVRSYDELHASDPGRFHARLRHYLSLEHDVDRVRLLDADGRVLFDSTPGATATVLAQTRPRPVLARAAQARGLTRVPAGTHDGSSTLEIVAPYVDPSGRRRAVAYRISYGRLRPGGGGLAWATAGLTLASVAAAGLVAAGLMRHITRPIEELTRGAQRIAEGRFDQRLDIWSGDEIQLLAEAFNHMASRLKENVEQLEHSNRKLAEVNEELKELDRLKSDLLANVSHELRTPLTAIKGYTDYMLERKLGNVTDKQEKGLIVVQRNLERLSKSIGALLDFSRMDMGHVALNIQPFGLAPLVEQVVTALRAELERKHLSFSISIDPALPPVIGDRERLSQVFENLIINAMKFTPEHGHVAVTAMRAGRIGRPTAEIRVRDTGIGIPANQLERIFHRFHQVDGSSTRRYGGVGLGLSIVKIILDGHGATISVHSEVGRGTEFRFELPVVDMDKGVPRGERGRADEGERPELAAGTELAGDGEPGPEGGPPPRT